MFHFAALKCSFTLITFACEFLNLDHTLQSQRRQGETDYLNVNYEVKTLLFLRWL